MVDSRTWGQVAIRAVEEERKWVGDASSTDEEWGMPQGALASSQEQGQGRAARAKDHGAAGVTSLEQAGLNHRTRGLGTASEDLGHSHLPPIPRLLDFQDFSYSLWSPGFSE